MTTNINPKTMFMNAPMAMDVDDSAVLDDSTAASGDMLPIYDVSAHEWKVIDYSDLITTLDDEAITSSAAELNILDGVTATFAELNYLDLAVLGTGAASKAVVLDTGDDYTWPATGVFTYGVLKDPAGTTLGATVAELNKLDDSVTVLTKGAGVSAAESYAVGYLRNGTLVHTKIVVDLSGLVGSATDLDIIGNTGGAASAHWGQHTVALLGTLIGGQVTCLEVPAGGTADIDFYSATVSTGAQDGLVTDLSETALITSGGNWTSGACKGMTSLPAANDYLYITNGAAAGGTFSAGKFLIELFGYVA